MAVPQNSVFEVQFKYLVNGQTCRNVIHFRNEVAFVTAFGDSVQAELLSEMNDADAGSPRSTLLDWLAGNVTLTGISCQEVWPARYRKSAVALNLGGEDTTSQCEAQNLQGTISKFGSLASRHEMGSVHIGGMPIGRANDGLITAAGITKLESISLSWFVPYTITVGAETVTMEPCIINHTKVIVNGKPTYPISGSAPISSVVVQPEVRTQRSRNVGRGE